MRPLNEDPRQKHRAFGSASDIKECFDGKMIDQKLRYTHADAVNKKWRLLDGAATHPRSSFAFYTRGGARKVPRLAHQQLGYVKR